MGDAEVQATPGQAQTGMGLVERCQAEDTSTLRPLGPAPTHPKLTCESRMTGDCHVRFCESPGVRFPRATHLARSNSHSTRTQPSREASLTVEGGDCT